jgi:hypothetical protein
VSKKVTFLRSGLDLLNLPELSIRSFKISSFDSGIRESFLGSICRKAVADLVHHKEFCLRARTEVLDLSISISHALVETDIRD